MSLWPWHDDSVLDVKESATEEQAAPEGSHEFAALTANRVAVQGLFADRFRRAISEGDLPARENADELASFLITVTSAFAIRAADGISRESLLAMAHPAIRTFPETPTTSS